MEREIELLVERTLVSFCRISHVRTRLLEANHLGLGRSLGPDPLLVSFLPRLRESEDNKRRKGGFLTRCSSPSTTSTFPNSLLASKSASATQDLSLLHRAQARFPLARGLLACFASEALAGRWGASRLHQSSARLSANPLWLTLSHHPPLAA